MIDAANMERIKRRIERLAREGKVAPSDKPNPSLSTIRSPKI